MLLLRLYFSSFCYFVCSFSLLLFFILLLLLSLSLLSRSFLLILKLLLLSLLKLFLLFPMLVPVPLPFLLLFLPLKLHGFLLFLLLQLLLHVLFLAHSLLLLPMLLFLLVLLLLLLLFLFAVSVDLLLFSATAVTTAFPDVVPCIFITAAFPAVFASVSIFVRCYFCFSPLLYLLLLFLPFPTAVPAAVTLALPSAFLLLFSEFPLHCCSSSCLTFCGCCWNDPCA